MPQDTEQTAPLVGKEKTRGVMAWIKRIRRARHFALGIGLAAVFSAITTYVVMTRSENPFGPNPEVVIALATVNLILLLALVAVVAQRAFKLWAALRSGSVGSRLQTRIVLIFSLVTMIPTIIVAVFAAFFMNAGIQAWFSDKINTGLEESVAVAESYLNEHKNIISADARAMASDLDRELYSGITSPEGFNDIISKQAALRSLTEAAVLQNNQVLAQTSMTFTLAFERMSPQTKELADNGQVVVIADDDKIRAIMKLSSMPDAYLIIGRLIDGRVVKHMQNTQEAVNEYRAVKARLSEIQIQFSLMFVLVALLLLLAAIWYGMAFAAKLVIPITSLVEAAERVRAGDYATRVGEGPEDDELATLGRAFNRMTNQLASQRRDLMKVNRQLDARRRFSEAVLAGVSAGVIALDNHQAITLHNRSAMQLLQLEMGGEYIGKPIAEILPEVLPMLQEVVLKAGNIQQTEITVTRNDKPVNLHVRISGEMFDGELESYIITFDDITPLIVSQRHAAWSDVARRVAHEIKNPLTPIQLAAQRLKRKYLQQIDEADRENFAKYTDTITRHVGDIGKMVEEFVNFARMPAPQFTHENMNDLLTKTVFSEETTHSNITYILDLPPHAVFADCDASQLRQVLTNLVKNAAESIDVRIALDLEQQKPNSASGEIQVLCSERDGDCIIEVKDNGCGFPADRIHHMLEPYVTTRAKGTGLGLAIVKKIMEDHKGRVDLVNRAEGGAVVRLVFPQIKIPDARSTKARA